MNVSTQSITIVDVLHNVLNIASRICAPKQKPAPFFLRLPTLFIFSLSSASSPIWMSHAGIHLGQVTAEPSKDLCTQIVSCVILSSMGKRSRATFLRSGSLTCSPLLAQKKDSAETWCMTWSSGNFYISVPTSGQLQLCSLITLRRRTTGIGDTWGEKNWIGAKHRCLKV